MAALIEGPHEAKVERISLTVAGDQVDAIHARPGGPAATGIVVAPDINGLRPLFDDLARRLASHGFAVCVVEPFARIPRAEREGLDVAARMERGRELRDDVQLGHLSAAADYLERTDGVHRVCVLGFCMGGYYTLKAAAGGRFAKAVSCYGMVRTPPQWQGPGHHSTLDRAAQACPTLAVFGGRDPWTPAEDVEALRSAWRERPDCQVVVCPEAEHGF
ncbi:MAG TPA: dienelactone hydrolase family protein, partial [Dehalococcoidia bacterium]|nr:dienelactone hydrolase family protein [Dehalococcoidia bacterium]